VIRADDQQIALYRDQSFKLQKQQRRMADRDSTHLWSRSCISVWPSVSHSFTLYGVFTYLQRRM